jgi:hypothetical protein
MRVFLLLRDSATIHIGEIEVQRHAAPARPAFDAGKQAGAGARGAHFSGKPYSLFSAKSPYIQVGEEQIQRTNVPLSPRICNLLSRGCFRRYYIDRDSRARPQGMR